MARRERNDHPGAIHHVMNGGVDGLQIFRDPFDRRRFMSDLERAITKFDVELLAYAQITTHYHLVARSMSGHLAEAMQMLGVRYARYYNGKYERYGPLFRGRFTSRWIDSQEYLSTAIRYVHHNPFDLGVEVLAEYPWSSWPAYLGLEPSPNWLNTSLVVEHFGSQAALVDFIDPVAALGLRHAA